LAAVAVRAGQARHVAVAAEQHGRGNGEAVAES
jgi:hypothetical protein